MRHLTPLAGAAALVLAAAACGGDDDTTAAAGGEGTPTIVVSTTVLGDVVRQVVGDAASVEVVMPLGADPHEFEPSARQVEAMTEADLLVTNGAGFEEGVLGVLDAVEDAGVETFAFADHVELRAYADGESHDHDHADDDHADETEADAASDDHGEDDHAHDDDSADSTGTDDTAAEDDHAHDDDSADSTGTDDTAAEDDHAHDDDDHAHDGDGAATDAAGTATTDEEDHGDETGADEEHDHGDEDPHLWTDPSTLAQALPALAEAVGALDGVDAAAVEAGAEAYGEELDALDAEIEALVEEIPEERRVLVTDHEVFGYFADRYGLEVVGVIVPGGTTLAEPSSAALTELADTITAEGVPAIFAETTTSSQLSEALAETAGGDVEVVTLFTESLGEEGSGAETYVEMMRFDAEAINAALA